MLQLKDFSQPQFKFYLFVTSFAVNLFHEEIYDIHKL